MSNGERGRISTLSSISPFASSTWTAASGGLEAWLLFSVFAEQFSATMIGGFEFTSLAIMLEMIDFLLVPLSSVRPGRRRRLLLTNASTSSSS